MANVLRSAVSFVTGVVIARTLGASEYGNLNFLLGSFAALTFLLDMGSTPAFFTFLSQRRRTPMFFILYIGWTVGIQFVLMIFVLGALLPDSILSAIWVHQPRRLVLLACAASFFTSQVWLTIAQMGEARRKTVLVQSAGVLQVVVHLGLVVLLERARWLNVGSILWILIGEFALFAAIAGPLLLRANVVSGQERPEPWRQIAREFAIYCAPLVLYGWVNCAYTFGYRWLLQRFGGSAEQGYFSVGQQFATISLIATTSMLNVFWKEIAEARERGDQPRVRRLYTRTWRGLYCFAALVSCFLIPFSGEILNLTVGSGFRAARITLALMFLLPIHQSVGQLVGTFFYATGDTRRYTNVGMVMMAATLPLMYLMLAPQTAAVPGLALGSLGVALTILVVQIAVINVQSRWLARKHGWDHQYTYQAAVVLLFLALAICSRWVGVQLFSAVSSPLVSIIASIVVSGVLYCTAALAVVIWFPWFGVDREFGERLLRGMRFRLAA